MCCCCAPPSCWPRQCNKAWDICPDSYDVMCAMRSTFNLLSSNQWQFRGLHRRRMWTTLTSRNTNLHSTSSENMARISQSGALVNVVFSQITHNPPRSEDMSGFVESVPNVKQRIDQLQTQHTEELGKLCARQAEQYLEDARDRYAAQNDEAGPCYSDDIDVRCYQRPRTPPGGDVCLSRSSIVNLVMGSLAWNADSFTKRRWFALRMWRPLHHCGTSS